MTNPLPPIGSRDLARSVGGLRFGGALVLFEFQPSIGIVAKAMDTLALDISSFKEPITKSIKGVMIPSFRENFDVGGRPPWEPLAEYTIKLRGYDAWPILVRSGKLKADATSLHIWTITPTSASIQSWPQRSWYGVIHQAGYGSATAAPTGGRSFGSLRSQLRAQAIAGGENPNAAKIRIPQRRFILFQEQDEIAIRAIFFDWLTEKAEKAGRLR